MPQKPIKPNRPKMLAVAFALAMMAGFASVVAAEMLNNAVRTSRDLFSLADPHLVTAIPYIATRAEVLKRKQMLRWTSAASVPLLLLGMAAVHLFVRPLDEMWAAVMARLLG
jgi:hypothetical protein